MPTCAQPPIIGRDEALALADRIERGEITAADHPSIAALIRRHVLLTDLLREKNASIRRLQRVAFGPSSERRPHDARADQHDVGANRATVYSYDLSGDPTSIDSPAPTADVSLVHGQYYRRLERMTDGTGTTTFNYFQVTTTGQLGAPQISSIDGPLINDTITFAYDELGRRKQYTLSGVTHSWVFDALGRITQQRNQLGGTTPFTYSYDGPTDRLTSIAFPNGQQTTLEYYDAAGDHRLSAIRHTSPGPGGNQTFSYRYAATGRVEEFGNSFYAGPTTYAYDDVDQLTSFTPPGRVPQPYHYQYDPAGNRTGEGLNAQSPSIVSTHNDVNQLTGQSGDVNRALTYSPNGNQLSDGTRTYEWDGADRLTAIAQGTRRSEFTYDGFGRRVKIVEKDGATVLSDRRYIWDRDQILEERNASNQVTRRFYPQGFLQVSNSGRYYYSRDRLGSVWQVTDATGAAAAIYEYKPFGEMEEYGGNTVESPIGYAGYWVHKPSGLNLTWHRAYSAELGRWISRDPVGEIGGSNLYAYVSNSPTNDADPWGLFPSASCLAAATAAGAAAGAAVGAGIGGAVGAGAGVAAAAGSGGVTIVVTLPGFSAAGAFAGAWQGGLIGGLAGLGGGLLFCKDEPPCEKEKEKEKEKDDDTGCEDRYGACLLWAKGDPLKIRKCGKAYRRCRTMPHLPFPHEFGRLVPVA